MAVQTSEQFALALCLLHTKKEKKNEHNITTTDVHVPSYGSRIRMLVTSEAK